MEVGDTIPDFQLVDQEGKPHQAKSFLGKPLVVFFYPKDFTPGCTQQVCGFRDHMSEFLDYGIQVVGISSDSISSHAKFAGRYSLDFPILADDKGIVRKLFGVKGALFGLIPGRETFAFDENGTLVFKYRSLNPKEHISSVLTFFKKSHE